MCVTFIFLFQSVLRYGWCVSVTLDFSVSKCAEIRTLCVTRTFCSSSLLRFECVCHIHFFLESELGSEQYISPWLFFFRVCWDLNNVCRLNFLLYGVLRFECMCHIHLVLQSGLRFGQSVSPVFYLFQSVLWFRWSASVTKTFLCRSVLRF